MPETSRIVSATRQDVVSAILEVMQELGLRNVRQEGNTVLGEAKMNWRSWKQNLAATTQSVGTGETYLAISSSTRQAMDWGRGEEIRRTILDAVMERIGAAPETQADG